VIEGKNFTQTAIADIPVDTEYRACNFGRPAPIDIGGGVFRGHRLFPGDDTPRTFTDCNLMNCEPPPGSTLDYCNTYMTPGVAVMSQDTITLPDTSEITVDHHSILITGRFDPDTESYIDYSVVEESVID